MAIGGGARRVTSRTLSLRLTAAGGVLVAVAGVVVLVLAPSPRVLTVVGAVLVLIGSLGFMTAVIATMVRRQLRRQAEFVSRTVERGMLEALPPGRVMEHLLDRVYGPSPSNRDVATAVLGGEGAASDGSDLTISEQTEIDFRLTRVSDATYQLVMEQHYSFRNRVPTSRFVIFATSDQTLRDTIIAGCRLPLFELWFVGADEAERYFEESVESMRDSVQIGLDYVDSSDKSHQVPTCSPGVQLREVKLQDWGRYLSFFRTDLPNEEALDRRLYMDRLRIFEIDLHALVERGTSVVKIERLTVRSTTLQPFVASFCYWQAPFPCYVERMRFDTSRLSKGSNDELWIHVKPFTIRSVASPALWSSDSDVVELPVRAWLQPGHGMTLMWRPDNYYLIERRRTGR